MQSPVNYTYKDTRYVHTLTPSHEIAYDLKFLVEMVSTGLLEDSPSVKFDLLRETRKLAHNLDRLRTLARYENTKNVGFAILTLIRRFMEEFMQDERDRLRKILTFTPRESELVMRQIDQLTQSELIERTSLLASHRNIRTAGNSNHL